MMTTLVIIQAIMIFLCRAAQLDCAYSYVYNHSTLKNECGLHFIEQNGKCVCPPAFSISQACLCSCDFPKIYDNITGSCSYPSIQNSGTKLSQTCPSPKVLNTSTNLCQPCLAPLAYNESSKTCSLCSYPFYIDSITTICIFNCSTVQYANPNSGNNSCTCQYPYTYFPNLKICTYNCSSVPFSKGTNSDGTCLCKSPYYFYTSYGVCNINCSLIQNVNINQSSLSKGCVCKQPYYFDSINFACFINCSLVQYSTAPNSNNYTCICKEPLYFNTTYSQCQVNCSNYLHSITELQTQPTQCRCQDGYKWKSYECVAVRISGTFTGIVFGSILGGVAIVGVIIWSVFYKVSAAAPIKSEGGGPSSQSQDQAIGQAVENSPARVIVNLNQII